MRKIQKFCAVFLLSFSMPTAHSATKTATPHIIDYADFTGPEMLKIRVDNSELNLKKKAAVGKISITVSDEVNSVDSPNIFFPDWISKRYLDNEIPRI